MEGVRRRTGGEAADLHGRVHRGTLSSAAVQENLYPESRRTATAVGHRALEDKIVQQAVVTVLNEIYEEDFLGFSYGFRPGRRPA